MQEKIVMERNNRGEKTFLILFFLFASIVMAECFRYCLVTYVTEISPLLFGILSTEKLEYKNLVPAGIISFSGLFLFFGYFCVFIVRGMPYKISADVAALAISYDGLTRFTKKIQLRDIASFTVERNRRAYVIKAVSPDGRKKNVITLNGSKQDPSSVIKTLKDCLI